MLAKYTDAPTKKNPNPQPNIGTIWIEFNADENVGMKQLRDYMSHLVNGSFHSGIMVTVKPMTGMAIRLLRGATSITDGPKGGVEVFVEQDLLVNITKHELVPKHVLLSDEEKQQLLQRYRLKQTQLPRIQSTDPVAKYLGLRRGSVVKIRQLPMGHISIWRMDKMHFNRRALFAYSVPCKLKRACVIPPTVHSHSDWSRHRD
jgi:DNA-directed RNA polymerase I, II, and III subunit RPABC1